MSSGYVEAGDDNAFDYKGSYQYAISGTEVLDNVQTGLDVAGLVPGFGEIADGANALIYTARGDYGNAGLSAAAMIPFAGMAATGGKLLRKGLQSHHIIPQAVFRNAAFRPEFKNIKWVQNASLNFIKLPTPFHGWHPQYNRFVQDKIQDLLVTGNFNLASVTNLANTLRQQIRQDYRSYKAGAGNLNDQFRNR